MIFDRFLTLLFSNTGKTMTSSIINKNFYNDYEVSNNFYI